jgi:hypothetical protein
VSLAGLYQVRAQNKAYDEAHKKDSK